jgi:hypothetical protein
VTAVLVHHVIETVSYAIESEDASVLNVGDTGSTDEVWKHANRIDNLKAVFIETSLPNRMQDVANKTGHLTPSGLKQELKKMNTHDPDIYLYHMKLQYANYIQDEIAAIKDKNIHILKDGEVINI